MKKATLVALCGVVVVGFAGCVLSPPLKPDLPTMVVKDKIRLRVAVVVPESSVTFTQGEELPSPCLGEVAPLPYGVVFQQTVKEMFGQIFDEVVLVKTLSEVKRPDTILETTITGVSLRIGCPASPGNYIIVEGGLRSLDPSGKELWRSGQASRRTDFSFFASEAEFGQKLSSGISALVSDWTQELIRLPTHRYARGGRYDAAPVEDALKAQREGNYPAAVTALRRALQNDPKTPGVYRQAADLLLHLCDPDTAIRAADAALKLEPDDVGLRRQLGLAYAHKGDAVRAREYLGGPGYMGATLVMEADTVVIEGVEPDGPAAQAGLQPGDRIFHVAGVSAQDPEQIAARIRQAEPGSSLVLGRRRGGEEREATMAVGSVLDLGRSAYPAACRGQALNREGIAEARAQRPVAALAKFEEAVRAAPGLIPKAHYNAALVLEQTGRPREAIAHYVAAFQAFLLPQDQTETLSRLVALTQRAGISVPDTADRRYRVGILRAQQKRYEDAIQEFDAALVESPWLVDAYYNLGLVYDFVGRYQDALRAFRTYVQLAPTAPNAGAVKTKIVEIEDRLTNPPPTVAQTSSAALAGAVQAAESGQVGPSQDCFIATAAYGSYLDPHVQILRDFRDRYLLTNAPGRAFVALYRRVSPGIASYIRVHESLRRVTQWFLTPVVYGIAYPRVALIVLIGLVTMPLVYRRRTSTSK